MLDVHAEALEGANGLYHEFLLQFKASRPIVYGFVEGREDPSFYRGFIEHVLPTGWSVRLIKSGNRDAVLSVLADMPWERFQQKRICFFVDRDLSDFLPAIAPAADNLYVTDNYSIENDVVNSHVLERVMEEICGVTGLSDDEREVIADLFDTNLKGFCEALTPVMAQVLIWRRGGVRAHLDNIKPGELCLFADARLLLQPAYHAPLARVTYAATAAAKLGPSSEADLREAEADFQAGDGPRRFIRGKYLVWFFAEFVRVLYEAIPRFCARHATPPKLHLTMGAANAMMIIAPRARPPASLRDFLARNYVAYANSA